MKIVASGCNQCVRPVGVVTGCGHCVMNPISGLLP